MTFEITAAIIVIWIGIAIFIFRLDRKVKKIEDELIRHCGLDPQSHLGREIKNRG